MMTRIIKPKILVLISMVFIMGCSDELPLVEKNSGVTNFAVEVGVESVSLTWDLPSEIVTAYIVYYTPGEVYLTLEDGEQNQLTIDDIEGGIEYTFNISWLDAYYEASEIVSVSSTPEVRPPGIFMGDLLFKNQQELNGFELSDEAALETIDGNLIIESDGSDNIYDLSVLRDLKVITGNLEIRDNPILSNLSDLSSLTNVDGGNLTIQNNRNLVSFCGLGGLFENIKADISGNGFNPALDEILAGNCKTEDLVYDGYPRFNSQTEVDALPDGITHFPGELVIGLDAATNDITDLSKFSKLRHIGGRLIIQRSPLLTDLSGFVSLEFVGETDSDELVVRQMEDLITLNGLQALIHVGKRIGIRENPNLQTLEGLNNVREIGENKITIGTCGDPAQGNPLLTDYCALLGLIQEIGVEQLEQSGSCIDSYSNFNPSFQDILEGNCSQ
jgi:hypothetical protein